VDPSGGEIMNKIEGIIGTSENSFSIVVAALITYNEEIKNLFLGKADFPKDLNIIDITTEKCLDGIENRIDIFIEFEEGYILGVENKKWASFQNNQIERYASTSYFKNKEKANIIILTPSRYDLGEYKSILNLNYKQLIAIIKECTNSDVNSDIIEYLSEVELMPLTTDEITAQAFYSSGNKKLDSVLEELNNNENFQIENCEGVYKLFRKEIGRYAFYIGFRFGINNRFYLKEKLYNGKPECIIFLKELDENYINDETAKNIWAKIEQNKQRIQLNDKIDLVHGKGPVKVIIRKNIDEFIGDDLRKIVEWYRRIIKFLEEICT